MCVFFALVLSAGLWLLPFRNDDDERKMYWTIGAECGETAMSRRF